MSAEAITIERAAAARACARRGPASAPSTAGSCASCVAQKRTFIGVGAAIAVPLIFIVALLADSGGGGPEGVPFGEYVRESGLAVPLVCLFFGAIWLLPLITALVAGDIVAAEDHNGTLKTILTRSVERWQVFAGKLLAALTYTLGDPRDLRRRRHRRRRRGLRLQPADARSRARRSASAARCT